MKNQFSCSEDLLGSLKGPIAVVGNATPLRSFGTLIDEYPNVVRMNNFRMDGYENLVGTHTTLRCTTGWSDIEHRDQHPEFSPFTAAAAESANLESFDHGNKLPVLCAHHDIHTGVAQTPNPSCGLALVELFAHLGINVDLFGFDGFRTPHYWSGAKQFQTTHATQELDLILTHANVILFGESYPYEQLYNFCHDNHAAYDRNVGLNLVRHLNREFAGKSVLEFGAGNGDFASYLESTHNRVTALEVSASAFAKIKCSEKIHGDAFTLAETKQRFDLFASVDVLEHLTENDIRLVLREAGRLTDEIFLSVSTRPSGLLGPNGENLHLTVRPTEWWKEQVGRYFDVAVSNGYGEGQIVLEGKRRNVGITRESQIQEREPTVVPVVTNFCIKADYASRSKPEYFEDSVSESTGHVWQPDVYPIVGVLARKLNCLQIIDVGCGRAEKLKDLHTEFLVTGVDYGKNMEYCRQNHNFGQWIEADFERPTDLQISENILARSLVVCSDVIEHLVDPTELLRTLRQMLDLAPAIVLSTPERILVRGESHTGPPPNKAHVREWSLDELEQLLTLSGFSVNFIGLTRSNTNTNEMKTIMAVLTSCSSEPLIGSASRGDALYLDSDSIEVVHPADWDAESYNDGGTQTLNGKNSENSIDDQTIGEIEASAREALSIDPNGIEALKLLSVVCLQVENWQEAAHSAARVLEQKPDDLESLFVLAKAFFKSGDIASTRMALERVMEFDPMNRLAHENLSQLADSQKNANDQHKELERLITDGQEAIAQVNVPHALFCLEQATLLDPDDADLAVGLAGLLVANGKPDDARRHLSRALIVSPEHTEARKLLLEITLEDAIDEKDTTVIAPRVSEAMSVSARDLAFKEADELEYWSRRKAREGTLSNSHYEEFYTSHFGLDHEFYRNKRILDIGCGPRGSLEWAEMAAERVGLDPLADEYMKLGADQHKMSYASAPSEVIPFAENYFDVVMSFNSLDHVEDLDRTVQEIMRVLKPGGTFLLLTDVNHSPTPCEPIEFSWDIVGHFSSEFDLLDQKHYEKPANGGLYQGVMEGVHYDPTNTQKRYGILSAKFEKRTTVRAQHLSEEWPVDGNRKAFAHLQRGFDLLTEHRFSDAQMESRRYRESVDYDALPFTDNRTEKAPRASVIIVAYNINQGLIQCLDSLAASKNPPHEIIVVDNGGNESIHEELAKRDLLHVRVGFNSILAEGRNIGVHFARSNFAIFIDDDAIAAPNYIASAIEGFETFDVHAFRGKVLPKTDHPNNSRARHYDLGDLPFPADIDTEGNSAFRVDTWRELGGQDPLLFGGEGVDLSYRIGKIHSDLSLMYWPFMVIQHDYAVTDTKLETKSSRHTLMREYSVFKHPDLYTFHNRLVAFSLGIEKKTEGNKLLPRHAKEKSIAESDGANSQSRELFFSICVPTYNRAQFIEQTLDSALNQSHQNFEIVVVDDGSSDNTSTIMKRITDPRVRYIIKEHSGGPATRDRCVAEANGDFLIWLDSDDVLMPGTLELYAKTLITNPSVDVLYGHLLVGDENMNVEERWVYRDYSGWGNTLLADTVIENRIPNVCTLVRKSCYEKIGGYNPDFPRAHDYEFWTRLAPVATFKSVNTDVGVYRRHEASLSKVRKAINTSYEANAVKAMLINHPLDTLFPFCYAGESCVEGGNARAWLIAALLMLKYGDQAAAEEFVKRSKKEFPLKQTELLASLLSGNRVVRKKRKATSAIVQLIETAVAQFAAGNTQPCARACAQLTELDPDSFETLLLVALSLQRWGGGGEARAAFQCLILRAGEEMYLDSVESSEAEASPTSVAASRSRLNEKLSEVFGLDSVPATALDQTLAFISELANADNSAELFSENRDKQTPLFHALLSLSKAELDELVDATTATQILELKDAFVERSKEVNRRKSGYSFCIITGGTRPEKVRRQIDSIRSLRLPYFEILVGGDISQVPADVSRVDLAEAAAAGRLGQMRNALAKRAQFDHVVMADDDIVFDPGFAEGLDRFGENYEVMAARILNTDGGRFWDWSTTGGVRGSVLLNYWESDPDVYVTGGFCVVKTNVLDAVQWDGSRGFYEFEDVDFSARLKAAGYTVRFNAFATVVHDDDNYTQVGQKVVRFDHLLGAVRQSFAKADVTETRRYLEVASRVAGNDEARRRELDSLVEEVGETTWFATLQQEQQSMRSISTDSSQKSSVTSALAINWCGSFLDYGSLSNINRALTDALENHGVNVARVPNQNVEGKPPKALRVVRRKLAPQLNENANLTVRHAWPPDWSRPKTGRLAVVQPWEFGSLPKGWVEEAENVDAFWVPSNHVRNVYVESGVSAEKVHVLPNGIDSKQFTPEAKPLAIDTNKSFKFLFVGGTIHRKGPDVLLKSFCETFAATDDVCLVIKDFGGGSVYAGQTMVKQIEQIRRRPNAPEILYLNEELPPNEMPGLFTVCDCLVHPYRGEGFGMPVLEAMACGLPVVVTAGGSTDDFVPLEAGYHIPSVRKVFGRVVGELPLAGEGWLLEPDFDAVKRVMRHVFSNRKEAAEKGGVGSHYAHENYSWDRVAERVVQLAGELVASDQSVSGVSSNDKAIKQSTATSGSRNARKSRPREFQLPPAGLLGQLGDARGLLKQKKLVPAWDAAQGALKARPFHPEAYLLMAEIACIAGQSKMMKQCIDRVVGMVPNWKQAKKFVKSHPVRKVATTVQFSPLPGIASPRLTVCLIAKDEEQFIEQCLGSINSVADQIVVVDTGSTDRTVDIAKRCGAEVHHFDWCDDFSAARNAALEHANGDWVLVIDADEVLSPDSVGVLKKSLAAKNTIGWRLPIVDEGHELEGCSYVARLFRNAPALFYVSRVHEQVFSSVEVRREEWGMTTEVGKAKLLHHGYTKEMVEGRNKIDRNLKLLEKAIEEIPGDPNLLMNYGLELVRSERFDEGLAHYAEAFDSLAGKPKNEITPELRETLLTQYSSHLMKVKNWDEIIRLLNSDVAKNGGLTASLHFNLGLAHQELCEWTDAVAEFRQCLRKRHQKTFYLGNVVIQGGAPRHCLALALWKSGNSEAAAKEFAVGMKEDPSLLALQMEHARFLLDQGQPIEGLQRLHGVVVAEPGVLEAWLMGGNISLSDPDFIEFSRDWTSEAMKYHSGNEQIAANRAEMLMLTQQFADAIPIWRQLGDDPRALSARLLCELMQDDFSIDEPPANEREVSQEFLAWYRRLIRYNAAEGIRAVNERLEVLRMLLPSAATALEDVLRRVAVEAA